MDDSLDTLSEFVQTILNTSRDLSSLGGPVLHYGLFLRQILNSKRPAFLLQREINAPTQVESGAAVAPWHAAACLDDRVRTAAFIRGSIRAVERQLDQCSHRPLHLVEAGCGPLGTLVFPLLAHFNSDELVVSLIDLHEESIQCMEVMLDHFGFLSRSRQLVCGDVTVINLDTSVDIVLSETMNTALSQEPQVAVTRAVMRRNPDAILIPQSIRVDCALLDWVTESSHFPPQVCDRKILATVFELNRKTALELIENDGLLPAARVDLPDSIRPEQAPYLTTTVQVFEDTQFSDYETQISHPIPLQLSPGDTTQFSYRMGDSPGLIWELIESDQ